MKKNGLFSMELLEAREERWETVDDRKVAVQPLVEATSPEVVAPKPLESQQWRQQQIGKVEAVSAMDQFK